MGSSFKSKSTGAGLARSVKPSPKPGPVLGVRHPIAAAALEAQSHLPDQQAPAFAPEGVQPPTKPRTVAEVLVTVRRHLRVALAATAVCSTALASQHADSDSDAALVLQRCVGDELDRQIGQLDAVLGASSAVNTHGAIGVGGGHE